MKKLIALFLTICLLASLLAGCTDNSSKALLTNIKPSNSQTRSLAEFTNEPQAVSDFSVRLFQHSLNQNPHKNTLVSPLSVLLALSMTANGAEGETLAQMEAEFGLPMEQLNEYLLAYVNQLPQGDKYKLNIANSIWLRDDPELLVKQEFLQTNANFYQAQIYQAPFNASTVNDINKWVRYHTNRMIGQIIEEISPNTMLYLINALSFEAEWETIYEEYQIWPDAFTTEDGQKQQVDFMYSGESLYLENADCRGFIKYYLSQKYAFVALLPNESLTVADLANRLDGAQLRALLDNAQQTTVHAALPKFSVEYDCNMNDILQQMGLTNAFNPALADFSGIADYPLFINQVLHKTRLVVDEKGTKAGAATAVGPEAGYMTKEIQEVYLDRPFIYLLIDCQTQQPLFIGTVMELEEQTT